MKNILLLSALLIFACSGDDSSDNNSSNYKLVDTYQYSYVDNDQGSDNFGNLYEGVVSYNYDGNKLLNVTDDESGVLVNYTYNEDNLISAVYFSGGDVAEFEYDNQGRLSVYTYTDVDDYPPGQPGIDVANFVYNQDGSVVQTWQGEGQSTYTFLFDQNGNITKTINPDAWDGNTEKNYTYDNKNNPFKNILGHSFFVNIWYQAILPSLGLGINNNVITAENENNIFFYTYDEDDYPISINSPNGSDYKSNIQINITYTN